MASLQITYDDLRRYVGRFIGATRTPSALTGADSTDVEDCLESGLRNFYWPEIGGTEDRFCWSFLRREGTLSLLPEKQSYGLPEDFSRMITKLNYGKGLGKSPIGVVSEGEIAALTAVDGKSADAQYCVIRATSAEQSENSRTLYQAHLYPIPISSEDVTFTYSFEPPSVDSDNIHPLGGAMHAETIKEACLSSAEEIINPEAEEGVHTKKFRKLLEASMNSDSNLTKFREEPGTWPVDGILGSTGGLDINKGQLSRLVGDYMFKMPNPSAWTHGQKAEISEIVRTGLREFYNPKALPGERAPHFWSFLAPTSTITTEASTSLYDLPKDFSVLHGPITYAPGEASLYPPIKVVSERRLENSLQTSGSTGRPIEAAIRPKKNYRLYELMLWPQPDDAYILSYSYSFNPEQLEDDSDLPQGGQPHSQTIIESCLAAAEVKQGSRGIHNEEFGLRLVASVGHDREVYSPDSLGDPFMEGDWTDRHGYGEHGYGEHTTTHNGITY